MPYSWIKNVLLLLASVALIGAFGFVARAVFTRRRVRRKPLLRAGYSVAGLVLVAVANYALIWKVQLPAMAGEAKKAIEGQTDAASLVRAGDSAPNFRVKTMSGSDFDLEGARGKVILLNFFATWCGPCRQELPHIQKIWDDYKARPGFVLLVVGREETDDSLKAFMATNNYSFPVAADPKRASYALYAEKLIPRTYLIGPDGKILMAHTGFSKEGVEELKAELDRQLAGPR